MKKQTFTDFLELYPAIKLEVFAKEAGWNTANYLHEMIRPGSPEKLRKNFAKRIIPVMWKYGWRPKEDVPQLNEEEVIKILKSFNRKQKGQLEGCYNLSLDQLKRIDAILNETASKTI